MHPSKLDAHFADGLLPLGGISGVTTILCNEGGPYVLYRADEHGFQNRPGSFAAGRLDVGIVGDSYAQGWCVRPDESFAALIQRRWPATLNVAMAGDGPLSELASFREYLAATPPRVLLWFYYEGNDCSDLRAELAHPTLRRYRSDSAFSQHLLQRQGTIDSALETLVASDSVRAASRRRSHEVASIVKSVVTLSHLREAVASSTRKSTPQVACDPAVLAGLVDAAGRTVRAAAGRLLFVYLPSSTRYFAARSVPSDSALAAGDRVIAAVRGAGYEVLDLRQGLIAHEAARALYLTAHSHLGPRGHKAVADTVLKLIEPWITGSSPLRGASERPASRGDRVPARP